MIPTVIVGIYPFNPKALDYGASKGTLHGTILTVTSNTNDQTTSRMLSKTI